MDELQTMKPPDLLQFHVEKHSRNIILECCTICQISLSESGEPLSMFMSLWNVLFILKHISLLLSSLVSSFIEMFQQEYPFSTTFLYTTSRSKSAGMGSSLPAILVRISGHRNQMDGYLDFPIVICLIFFEQGLLEKLSGGMLSNKTPMCKTVSFFQLGKLLSLF